MRLVAYALIALLLLHAALAVRFTEIMYDPPGNDNNREFIEVEGAWNLTGWTIADAASNDTLVPLQVNASSGYALIVEEGFDYANLSCSVYSAGSTIGNNLNNGGDSVFLYTPNGTLAAATDYTSVDGGSSDGRALVMRNGSWAEGGTPGGTPCRPETAIPENGTETGNETNTTDMSGAFTLSITLPGTIFSGIPYDGLFKVENTAYAAGDEYRNVTVGYAVTGDGTHLNGTFSVMVRSYRLAGTGTLMLNGTGNYTLCGRITAVDGNATSSPVVCRALAVLDPFAQPCDVSLALEVEDGKVLFDEGDHIRFRNRVERHDNGSLPPFIVRYWAEDLDGKVLRVSTTGNLNQKSFTPHVDGAVGVYLLKDAFDMLACNNSGKNVTGERLVVVKGAPDGDATSQGDQSSLEILDLHEPRDGYEAGDGMLADVRIVKGDTRKYSVKLWTEDAAGRKASAVTTFRARQQGTYEATLPLLLKQGLPTGDYRVVLEGLGERTGADVRVRGKTVEKNATPEALAIASFYTRAKLPAERIALYATVKGNANVTLDLVGLQDHGREDVALDGSYAYKAEVAMAHGPNPFILRVLDAGGKTLATKGLLLEMDDAIRQVDWFTKRNASVAAEASAAPDRTEPTGTGKGTSGNASGNASFAPVTGALSYSEQDNTRLLPALLGLVGLLLLGIVLQHRR